MNESNENDTILKNPTIRIGGKEIETSPNSLSFQMGFPRISSFMFGLKLTQENIDLSKSIKEQVQAYQNTRYNDLNLKSIENPATLKLFGELYASTNLDISFMILDIDYKIIDFNSLHLFHMTDDDDKKIIEPATYMDICSDDQFNKIIVYGILTKID